MEPIIKVFASQDYVENNTVLYSEAQVLTAEQKTQAFSNLGFYNQETEPADADVGSLWIDTSEDGGEGGTGGNASIALDTTLTQAGMAADAKAVGDAIKNKADTGHTHDLSEVGITTTTEITTDSTALVTSGAVAAYVTAQINAITNFEEVAF